VTLFSIVPYDIFCLFSTFFSETIFDVFVKILAEMGGFQDEVFAFFTMGVWKSPKNITLFVKFFILLE